MDKKTFTKAEELISNGLKLMGVEAEQIQVTEGEESLEVQIDLPEDELGMFIGHRGETIASLQLILAMLVNRRLNEWVPVRVNVGDYRERRYEALVKKAQQAAERALDAGQEVVIPNLNSYERRQIHMYFSDNDLVRTESRGDEPFRQLIVMPQE